MRIDPAFATGFFAFKNPAKDRMMANWFIAAERDNPLLVALHDTFLALLTERRFPQPEIMSVTSGGKPLPPGERRVPRRARGRPSARPPNST
jgi:hypothetical protein